MESLYVDLFLIIIFSFGIGGLFCWIKNKVQKPIEVKLCLNEVKKLKKEIDALDSYHYISAFEIIAPYLKKLLQDKRKVVSFIKVDNISPRNLVLLLCRNILGDLIQSGEYHIYPGILSITGQNLSILYRYIIHEFEKNGFLTKDEARENEIWLNNKIKNIK